MEIKRHRQWKKNPVPQSACDGGKGGKKKMQIYPCFLWLSSEVPPTASAPAPPLSTVVVPVLKNPLGCSGELRCSSQGYSPNFFPRLIIASLELSFPPAASHPGVSGSGTSTEHNESLPFHSPAPRFAEEGNERLYLTGSGGVLHKAGRETRPSSEPLTRDAFIARG